MSKQVRPLAARLFPVPRLSRDLPPFWELEQLLREGCDRESALAELARRREELTSGARPPSSAAQPGIPDGLFTIMS